MATATILHSEVDHADAVFQPTTDPGAQGSLTVSIGGVMRWREQRRRPGPSSVAVHPTRPGSTTGTPMPG